MPDFTAKMHQIRFFVLAEFSKRGRTYGERGDWKREGTGTLTRELGGEGGNRKVNGEGVDRWRRGGYRRVGVGRGREMGNERTSSDGEFLGPGV